jgi:chemotaxis signal transduction protein
MMHDRHVLFRLCGELYALPVGQVSRVVLCPPVSPRSKWPPAMISAGDERLPVLDLRPELAATEDFTPRHLVVIESRGRRLAVPVDAVVGIASCERVEGELPYDLPSWSFSGRSATILDADGLGGQELQAAA